MAVDCFKFYVFFFLVSGFGANTSAVNQGSTTPAPFSFGFGSTTTQQPFPSSTTSAGFGTGLGFSTPTPAPAFSGFNFGGMTQQQAGSVASTFGTGLGGIHL